MALWTAVAGAAVGLLTVDLRTGVSRLMADIGAVETWFGLAGGAVCCSVTAERGVVGRMGLAGCRHLCRFGTVIFDCLEDSGLHVERIKVLAFWADQVGIIWADQVRLGTRNDIFGDGAVNNIPKRMQGSRHQEYCSVVRSYLCYFETTHAVW